MHALPNRILQYLTCTKISKKKNQSKEDLLMSNISLEETILLAGGFSLNVVAETYAEEILKC
jgi:hypothetical protein